MNSFEQYFKCPERYSHFALKEPLSSGKGYFRFGDAVCFGRYDGHRLGKSASEALPDSCADVKVERGVTYLPFDLDETIDALRLEQYTAGVRDRAETALSSLYYGIRPMLPVSIRKYMQRVHLKGWDRIAFPHWPVDRTVDDIFENLMLLTLRANKVAQIPFIWFWPDGRSSCSIMTHDVETTRGRDFCAELMDIDDRFEIKASFQIVPERRYTVTKEYLDSFTSRGFEVGVQDLNHDGRLYRSREQFRSRAAKINEYARQWGAKGFRSAVLYRRQEWFAELNFAYDMSVPNVAHLDPQRGGCCTVMPYFLNNLLEIPVTTTQDYSLFHILKDYSIDLWKQQIDLIRQKHGLISFIIHPDYILGEPGRSTYEALLAYLAQMRKNENVWIPTPGEMNDWWRDRAKLRLVEENGEWRIEGHGHARARLAFARDNNGRLEVTLDTAAARDLVKTNTV